MALTTPPVSPRPVLAALPKLRLAELGRELDLAAAGSQTKDAQIPLTPAETKPTVTVPPPAVAPRPSVTPPN